MEHGRLYLYLYSDRIHLTACIPVQSRKADIQEVQEYQTIPHFATARDAGEADTQFRSDHHTQQPVYEYSVIFTPDALPAAQLTVSKHRTEALANSKLKR